MQDSLVVRFMNKAADLILLNFIFLIACIPLFTIGAAATALYYVCIISIREGDGYVIKRFIRSFRQNFKQATMLWMMILIFTVVMGVDLFFWYRIGTLFAKVMFCMSGLLAFLVGIVMMYLFPVTAKLEGSMKVTIKNSAAFAIGYFPYTLVLLLFSGLFIYANLISIGMNAISFFIGFALLAYMKSFFYYKIFMKHIDERYDDFDLSDEGTP